MLLYTPRKLVPLSGDFRRRYFICRHQRMLSNSVWFRRSCTVWLNICPPSILGVPRTYSALWIVLWASPFLIIFPFMFSHSDIYPWTSVITFVMLSVTVFSWKYFFIFSLVTFNSGFAAFRIIDFSPELRGPILFHQLHAGRSVAARGVVCPPVTRTRSMC